MRCEHVHENLSAYLDKELTAELTAAVRAHLDECPACRALLEGLRATADLLGRLPKQTTPAHLSEDVLRAIERRTILASPAVEEEQPQERTLALRRATPWPRALAVAASVLLVAGIAVLAYLGRTPHEMAPAAVEMVVVNGRLNLKALEEAEKAGFKRHRGEEGLFEVRLAGDDTRVAEFRTSAVPAPRAWWGFDADGTALYSGERAGRPGPTRVPSALGTIPGHGLEHDGVILVDNGYGGREFADRLQIGAVPVPEELANVVTFDGERLGVRAGAPAGGRPRAPSAAVVVNGPTVVQRTMNEVVLGIEGIEKLQEVATIDNLRRAGNTLVIETDSRNQANEDLKRLFWEQDWQSVEEAKATSWYRQDLPVKEGASRTPPVPGEKGLPRPAAGFYFLARQNGEDTWIIVTDRDNLSRFGGQLAQAANLRINWASNRELNAIALLQSRLRALGYQVVEGDLKPGRQLGRRTASETALTEETAPRELTKAGERGDKMPDDTYDEHLARPEEGRKEREQVASAPTVPQPAAGAFAAEADLPARAPAKAKGVAEEAAEVKRPEALQRASIRAKQNGPKPTDRPDAARPQIRKDLSYWDKGLIYRVAPLPENQVLLIIRVQRKADTVSAP